jgi:hypothetical protein
MFLRSREFSHCCTRYRVELLDGRRASEGEQRTAMQLLARIMLGFEYGDSLRAHSVLLDLLFALDRSGGGWECRMRELPRDVLCRQVHERLKSSIWLGQITLTEVKDNGLACVAWAEHTPTRSPLPSQVRRPQPLPSFISRPCSGVDESRKTWFAAQFVDEGGRWIAALDVNLEVDGGTQRLTTDDAGVVKLAAQTSSHAWVSVADVAQAEAILASRIERPDEHSTPKGNDVVNYRLTEPASSVVLQAELPWTIVLGLERTWFEVRVVDECGLAVAGLDMRFSANEDAIVTTDGIGVARFETFGAPNGRVTIASVAQARAILAPRWEKVRKPLNLGGPHLSTHQLTDDVPSVALPERHRHTLVLTPARTFIEIRVVDDNNNPISGKRAKLFLTDGRVIDTMLGADGVVRAEEIPAGDCRLELPIADRAEWFDPDARPPEVDVDPAPEGHWIVRQDIESPGPEVARLPTGEAHVVVVGRKRAEQLEIDDALFRVMSAVLLPEGQSPGADPTEPDGTRPTTLDLLAASLRYAQQHPDRKLLITGHTDTSGGDEYNQNLSEFRAAAVHAVLTNGSGSREDFGDIAHGPHLQGKEKKQQVLYDDRVQVLNWVAATFGWSCATSGEYGDYLRAVKSFQSTYNDKGNDGAPLERLDVDGDFGPASWRAVFDCYQMRLAETLGIEADELRSLQDEVGGRFVAHAPVAGCGENKPKEMAGVDNYRSQTNRRVEVLFFEPGHEPKLPCFEGKCDPKACELYDRRWYRRKRLPAQVTPAEPLVWRIRMHGQDGRLMKGTWCRVSGLVPTTTKQADGDAWLEFDAPSVCGASVLVEWGALDANGPFPYTRDIFVECAGDEQQVAQQRLRNLGYGTDEDLEVAATSFQTDYEVPEAGLDDEGGLPPLTRARLEKIWQEDCDATR